MTGHTIIAREQERYSPSLELAFKIARGFAVPLEEVFSFEPGEKGREAKISLEPQVEGGQS